MIKSEKSTIGKKSRAAGQRFESKVRKDLEEKGWIVTKWMNTVDCDSEGKIGKLIPAKRVYNPFMKAMTIGTGFPDFVCFKKVNEEEYIDGTLLPKKYQNEIGKFFEVIGLEVKSNGYLDKIEKGMCFWLLKTKVFSRILIASRTKKRGEIKYLNFKEKYEEK